MTRPRRDREMTIWEHLEEFRRRVIYSLIALVLATGLSGVFYKQILLFLMRPVHGFANVPAGKPVFTELTEMVGLMVKVSLVSGLILALPFILYQVIMFAAPGLTRRERIYLFVFLPGTMLAFATGAFFGYFVLFPPALNWLLTFGSDVAIPFIRIGNYVNLLVTLLFGMGMIFETPVVMFLLARLGVTSPRAMAAFRRYLWVLAFLVGAIITPTMDPLNQSLVALPLIVLYEVGILLARLAWRQRARPSLTTEGAAVS